LVSRSRNDRPTLEDLEETSEEKTAREKAADIAKRYEQTHTGKEVRHRKNTQDSGKEAKRKYKQTEHGRVSNQKYRGSDKGQTAKRRELDVRIDDRIRIKIMKTNIDNGNCLCGKLDVCEEHKEYVEYLK
jgi:hypothetical protein